MPYSLRNYQKLSQPLSFVKYYYLNQTNTACTDVSPATCENVLNFICFFVNKIAILDHIKSHIVYFTYDLSASFIYSAVFNQFESVYIPFGLIL